MPSPFELDASEFQYPLPEERIALFPLEKRSESKLLWVHPDHFEEHVFDQLPSLLPENSLLVLNDTKVIHSRLKYQREGTKPIEIFCLEPEEQGIWKTMVGNAKKWKGEKLLWKAENGTLSAEKTAQDGKLFRVKFEYDGFESFEDALSFFGEIPLPPYLQRKPEPSDAQRYQTVFGVNKGSVAAPTASLHFDESVLTQLEEKGISKAHVTLHVGAGTFWPMAEGKLQNHEMHAERMQVSLTTLRQLRDHDGPIIPVGTTAIRTTESIYFLALKSHLYPDLPLAHCWAEQWEPYTLNHSIKWTPKELLDFLIQRMENHGMTHISGITRLMIAPGFTPAYSSGLITNFHQPGSTLLVLVAALLGPRWKEAYEYALAHDFRFLSYGDSMLIYPFGHS